jgi:BirA family biotin operon repressor/biotin-[acetyl-CoA-carboxylase] ligase
MPKAEAIFWEQVRAGRFHGFKFKRQVPITPYVADFLCASARLVVELDGPPHDKAQQIAKDAARDRWFRSQGFTVLRFSNELVFGGLALVMREVLAALEAAHGPSPGSLRSPPSPAEGRGFGGSHA